MLVVLVVTTVFTIPVLAREAGKDWLAYQLAGLDVASGARLYESAEGEPPYLYPPAFALLWAAPLDQGSWLLLKTAILAISAFASPVVAVVALASLLTTPLQHDLILGNVMLLYLIAVLLLALRPGWWSAVAIGAVIGLTLKPTLLPLLVWMLVARPREFARALGVAAVISLVASVLLGPARYVEYLEAIPTFANMVRVWQGNVGVVSHFGPQMSLVISVLALAVATLSAWRWRERALPIALSMTLLFQPSLGIVYGVMLIPAIALLWKTHHSSGLAVALVAPILSLISPVLTAMLVALMQVRALVAEERGAGS